MIIRNETEKGNVKKEEAAVEIEAFNPFWAQESFFLFS